MSLNPQTIRVRHRLGEWTKQGRKQWDMYRWMMDPHILHDGLKQVIRNGGAPGIDGETCEEIKGREWEYVTQLSQLLRTRSYRPAPVKRVYIPKKDGRQRPLGIPQIRDRVVQASLVLLLEPIYEQVFLPCSYGFRPKRSAVQCVAESAQAIYRKRYVLEADIEGFFDHVVHRKLKGMLREKIVDPRILDLISQILSSGSQELNKPWEPSREGTPQGGPLSPMLANIYLHYALDKKFQETVSTGKRTELYRYCDDFIIVTDHPGRLKTARRALYAWMKEAGLKLNESKTCEINMSNHCRSHKSHFDFLGYRIHLRAFEDNPKRFWIARQPSEKSRKALRENIRKKLRPNLTLDQAREVLFETWRGWSNYFRYGNSNRVFYRENKSMHREVNKYLRTKYRKQRRPVPWHRLHPLRERILKGLRPVRVIPGPFTQSQGELFLA